MDITLDALVGTLQECGCCPPPLCCAPLVECQSRNMYARVIAFIKYPDASDSDSDVQAGFLPHYRTRAYRNARDEVITTTATFPGPESYTNGGESYTAETIDYNYTHDFIEEYSDIFSVPDAVPHCRFNESVYSYRCEVSGGYVRLSYATYATTAAGPPVTSTWHTYLAFREEVVYSDVSGLESDAHLEWEALYTDAATWQGLHDTWVTDNAAWNAWDALRNTHDEWEAVRDAHDAWEADPVGEEPPIEGSEPPEEGAEPPNPDEPGAEPEALNPPCTMRTTTTQTSWEVIGLPGGGVEVRLVDYGSDGPDNPQTFHSDSAGGNPGSPDPVVVYSNLITFESWLAAVDAFHTLSANFDGIEDESTSTACTTRDRCSASKDIYRNLIDQDGTWNANFQWFRYRFKLNKCCAWQSIRSEWDEILYRQEWLDWKATMDARGDSESTPDPVEPSPEPVKTAKVWEWTGTPPRCPDDSSLSSDAPPVDPYDHEPMWSPWSAVVKMPAGEIQGVILNRNYQQKCYEAPPQQMPDVFGTYEDDSRSV